MITIEYPITSENKQIAYSSVGGERLVYTQGANQVIPGVESAVEEMTVGQTKQVIVNPAGGFRERDPKAVQEMPKANIPDGIQVGTQLQGKDLAGREVRPTVKEIKNQTVLLDFNHPLDGKTLILDLKIVGIN